MCCTSYLLSSEWSMWETYTFKTANGRCAEFSSHQFQSANCNAQIWRRNSAVGSIAWRHTTHPTATSSITPSPWKPPLRTPYTDRRPLGCAKRWGGRRPGSMRGTNPLAYLFIYREKADIFKKQIVKWRMLWIIAFSSLAYGTNWIAVEVGWELPFKQVSPLWGGKMPDTY